MRRTLTVLTAVALAVGLAGPGLADATERSGDQPTTAYGERRGGKKDHGSGDRRDRGDRKGGRHGDDGWDGRRDRGDRDHRRDRYDRRDYGNRYYYDYYDRDRSYDGGCGYYGCDPYAGGYDGEPYDDGYYRERYYDCDGGPRYDTGCPDCYSRDTPCDRYDDRDRRYDGGCNRDGRCDRDRDRSSRRYDRGCDCYRPYDAPAVSGDAPADVN